MTTNKRISCSGSNRFSRAITRYHDSFVHGMHTVRSMVNLMFLLLQPVYPCLRVCVHRVVFVAEYRVTSRDQNYTRTVGL